MVSQFCNLALAMVVVQSVSSSVQALNIWLPRGFECDIVPRAIDFHPQLHSPAIIRELPVLRPNRGGVVNGDLLASCRVPYPRTSFYVVVNSPGFGSSLVKHSVSQSIPDRACRI